MPQRRMAIELVFEDDFALLDFQEKDHDLDLIYIIIEYLSEQVGDGVTVETGEVGSYPYLQWSNLAKHWSRDRGPRPSEIAIAAAMQKEHPDKTHWQHSRELLERQYAERERRRRDAEYEAALLQEAEEAEAAALLEQENSEPVHEDDDYLRELQQEAEEGTEPSNQETTP